MARPIKKGLDYFPLDVTLRGKIEYIQCMYGMLGVMVIISLWQRIYANSYYIEYDKNSSLVMSKDFGSQLKVIDSSKAHWEIFNEIVISAVEFGIFDKKLYERYHILTSRRIQEYYLKAKEKSSKIEINKDYLLLSDVNFSENSEEIGVNSEETGIFTPENSTKESRVNKSREKESRINEREGTLSLAPEEYNSLVSEFGEDKVKQYINHFTEYCNEKNKWKNYPNPAATIRRWIVQDIEKDKDKPKKSGKFNNYTDTNEIDFKAFEEQTLNEMMEG